MRSKHLAMRIRQCLELAKCSNCSVRGGDRKFGAILLDPDRNVTLMDGYNGGPRGGTKQCGGDNFCLRHGYRREDFEIKNTDPAVWQIYYMGEIWSGAAAEHLAEAEIQKACEKHPPIPSGTRLEVGCYHAEQNVILNAAANGVPCKGAWLIVNGEPCLMCAKLIYHAGITRVILVTGVYSTTEGVEFLEQHGVAVTRVDDPENPPDI